MKTVHIVLAILTVAFIVTLGVLSHKYYQEHPPEKAMTEEQAFAIYGEAQ